MAIPKALDGTLELPVIASPMFIVSYPELVIAQCKAGIVGSFPALNARPQSSLSDWLKRIEDELGQYQEEHPEKKVAPYAVNQIAHRSNTRLMADVETCVEHKVPVIITSLRAPREVVEAIHSYGGVIFHDIINIRHAKKAIDEGVDGLIPVCAGAGGHAGTMSPFALVPELRQFFDGPIALSGCISTGRSILAAQAVGADFAYMGTRFIPTTEANAAEGYKQMVVDSAAKDIVYSSFFSGVHANFLAPSVERAGMDPWNLPEADPTKMDFSPDGAEAKAWKDIWSAGQGVGQISDVEPVADVVAKLKREYDEAKAALCR